MGAVPFKFLESGSVMTQHLKRQICLTCPMLFRENSNDQERTWGSANESFDLKTTILESRWVVTRMSFFHHFMALQGYIQTNEPV